MDSLEFNGVEISTIPVINRPSYFLVNNYGRESYMTILEPVEDFKITPERKVLAGAYHSVMQLAEAFKDKAPVGSKETGYDRKDIVEIFFMGFKWRWRPNHKSFYGGIKVGYELLPLIARWIILTKADNGIDNQSPNYLPPKYKDGNGSGFGGYEVDAHMDSSPEELTKHFAEVDHVIADRTITPMTHSLAGGVVRAAQMNFVPKEAFAAYDQIISSLWDDPSGHMRINSEHRYVIRRIENNVMNYYGAFYGNGELPDWVQVVESREHDGVKVTFVKICAPDMDEAELLMEGVINTPVKGNT